MGATARPATGAALPHASRPAATKGGAAELALSQSLPEDAILLRQVRRGDRDALEQIVFRHQGAVYGYLRARLLQPADAEDLCQEVFLRCYAGKVKFERATQLRPWLIGIARNVLREHVRRQVRSREVAWTEMCLELDELGDAETDAHGEAMEHLPHCLDTLGPSARQAIDLRYAANLRLADIGERLHRSEGAVKLLVFRARQALKKCLDFRLGKSA